MAGVLEQMQAQCHQRGLSYADEMARLAGLWLDTEVAMGPSRASVSGELVQRYGTADAELEREQASGPAAACPDRRAVASSPNLGAVLRVLRDASEPVGVAFVVDRAEGLNHNTARDRLRRACGLGFAERDGLGPRPDQGRAPHLYRITGRGRAVLASIGGGR
jgi:hypothetical protein